jgi:hypothetical protein
VSLTDGLYALAAGFVVVILVGLVLIVVLMR